MSNLAPSLAQELPVAQDIVHACAVSTHSIDAVVCFLLSPIALFLAGLAGLILVAAGVLIRSRKRFQGFKRLHLTLVLAAYAGGAVLPYGAAITLLQWTSNPSQYFPAVANFFPILGIALIWVSVASLFQLMAIRQDDTAGGDRPERPDH